MEPSIPFGGLGCDKTFGEMAIGEIGIWGNGNWRNGKYYLAKWEDATSDTASLLAIESLKYDKLLLVALLNSVG
jgi:hypothetical protein